MTSERGQQVRSVLGLQGWSGVEWGRGAQGTAAEGTGAGPQGPGGTVHFCRGRHWQGVAAAGAGARLRPGAVLLRQGTQAEC